VESCIKCIIDILQIFGFKESVTTHSPTVKQWLALVSSAGGDWLKVAKYKLAAFYASHNKQPMPKAPFSCKDRPDFLVGGGAGRFLHNLLKNRKSRECVLQSLKQAKKGMPRPDAGQLKKATLEFKETMTKPIVEGIESRKRFIVSWGDAEELPEIINPTLTREAVEQQLRRTVQEIFPEVPMTWAERVKSFFPSTSANYINSRTEAGAIGTLLTHNTVLKGLRRDGGYISYKCNLREEEMESEEINKYHVEEKGVGEFEAAFEKLWVRILKEAIAEEPEVVPVPLAEALKIRMITKGPPFQQMVLRNLWKFVHTILRRHKTFQLIGRPVTEEIVLNVLGRELKGDEVYLSGDYKAATDNLKGWVSDTIADEIANRLKLGESERMLFKRSLTGHLIDGKPQLRGQLMGSITSFPVLCIANAALCRWAIETTELRVYKLQDAKLMVNGDDVALRSKKGVYEKWRDITAFAGLEESLGKTYVSREFIDINSTSFERHETTHDIKTTRKDGSTVLRPCPFFQTKYVNIGLLYGLKRSGGAIGLNDQADPHNTVGTRARELLRLAPAELRECLMKKFISYHKDFLEKTRLPWYVPEWLGGLGLPIGSWGGPTELDLRLARAILLNWRQERPIPLGKTEVSWRTWMEAQDNMPEAVYCKEKGPQTEEYNGMVSRKCIDLLFDSTISLGDLFEQTLLGGKGRAAVAIRHNARLWSPKRYGARLPHPLALSDLEFQSRYANYLIISHPPHVSTTTRGATIDLD
jgi:hypothetical protein